jgi:hypothetical protein
MTTETWISLYSVVPVWSHLERSCTHKQDVQVKQNEIAKDIQTLWIFPKLRFLSLWNMAWQLREKMKYERLIFFVADGIILVFKPSVHVDYPDHRCMAHCAAARCVACHIWSIQRATTLAASIGLTSVCPAGQRCHANDNVNPTFSQTLWQCGWLYNCT